MSDPTKPFRDSIALDAAYLTRGVPAAIDVLAIEAVEELNRAIDDGRNPGREDDAAMVSGKDR
jgi:hypothetical protein